MVGNTYVREGQGVICGMSFIQKTKVIFKISNSANSCPVHIYVRVLGFFERHCRIGL